MKYNLLQIPKSFSSSPWIPVKATIGTPEKATDKTITILLKSQYLHSQPREYTILVSDFVNVWMDGVNCQEFLEKIRQENGPFEDVEEQHAIPFFDEEWKSLTKLDDCHTLLWELSKPPKLHFGFKWTSDNPNYLFWSFPLKEFEDERLVFYHTVTLPLLVCTEQLVLENKKAAFLMEKKQEECEMMEKKMVEYGEPFKSRVGKLNIEMVKKSVWKERGQRICGTREDMDYPRQGITLPLASELGMEIWSSQDEEEFDKLMAWVQDGNGKKHVVQPPKLASQAPPLYSQSIPVKPPSPEIVRPPKKPKPPSIPGKRRGFLDKR